jgi:hypothetical protein
MELSKKALGMALGIVWGLIIFIATLWIAGIEGGRHLIYLKQFYFGYGIGFWGAVIGLFWGFVSGYLVGWALAWFYNIFIEK